VSFVFTSHIPDPCVRHIKKFQVLRDLIQHFNIFRFLKMSHLTGQKRDQSGRLFPDAAKAISVEIYTN
jgi:hypothetical protein